MFRFAQLTILSALHCVISMLSFSCVDWIFSIFKIALNWSSSSDPGRESVWNLADQGGQSCLAWLITHQFDSFQKKKIEKKKWQKWETYSSPEKIQIGHGQSRKKIQFWVLASVLCTAFGRHVYTEWSHNSKHTLPLLLRQPQKQYGGLRRTKWQNAVSTLNKRNCTKKAIVGAVSTSV